MHKIVFLIIFVLKSREIIVYLPGTFRELLRDFKIKESLKFSKPSKISEKVGL